MLGPHAKTFGDELWRALCDEAVTFHEARDLAWDAVIDEFGETEYHDGNTDTASFEGDASGYYLGPAFDAGSMHE